ncbi:MAG: hypothetical protein ACE5HI_13350, partial [bacterium]
KNIFANLEVNGIENGNAENEISDNLFLDNQKVIVYRQVQGQRNLSVHHNVFFGNDTVLDLQAVYHNVEFTFNTVDQTKSQGIFAILDSYPRLSMNNFVDNKMHIVTRGLQSSQGDLLQAGDIEATNNWWGTVNLLQIRAKIRDGNQENVEAWLGKTIIQPIEQSEILSAYPRN